MAENTTEFIMCDYYLKKVLYASNRLISFFTSSSNMVKNTRGLVNTFVADDEFVNHHLEFKSDIKLYIPIFETDPGQRTLFMEELSTIFSDQNYIKNDSQVITSLNIEGVSNINDIDNIQPSFVQLLGNSIIIGVYQNIVEDYPYYEFKIAANLSAIYYNSLILKIDSAYSDIVSVKSDIDTFCTHCSTSAERTFRKAESAINKTFIDSSGNILWNEAIGTLDSDSQLNIKKIFKIMNVIINNVNNQIAYKSENMRNLIYDLDIE